MELKDFVSQTIIDIVQGVDVGAKEVAKLGARVNPEPSPQVKRLQDRAGLSIIDIEFHVALSVSDDTKKSGGAGISIKVFDIGARGETTATSGSSTSLKFVVPITLPPPLP